MRYASEYVARRQPAKPFKLESAVAAFCDKGIVMLLSFLRNHLLAKCVEFFQALLSGGRSSFALGGRNLLLNDVIVQAAVSIQECCNWFRTQRKRCRAVGTEHSKDS